MRKREHFAVRRDGADDLGLLAFQECRPGQRGNNLMPGPAKISNPVECYIDNAIVGQQPYAGSLPAQ